MSNVIFSQTNISEDEAQIAHEMEEQPPVHSEGPKPENTTQNKQTNGKSLIKTTT